MDIKIINALAELKSECNKHETCNTDCPLFVGEEDFENTCFLNNRMDPTDYDIDDLVERKNEERKAQVIKHESKMPNVQ